MIVEIGENGREFQTDITDDDDNRVLGQDRQIQQGIAGENAVAFSKARNRRHDRLGSGVDHNGLPENTFFLTISKAQDEHVHLQRMSGRE